MSTRQLVFTINSFVVLEEKVGGVAAQEYTTSPEPFAGLSVPKINKNNSSLVLTNTHSEYL